MGVIEESFHGSDLEVIARRFHINEKNIIPYASNVNPLGISPLARQALIDNIDAISAYPDRDYVSLKSSISRYCGADKNHLILGNGVSDLIRLIFKALAPENTLIVGPAYAEYARAAILEGGIANTYMLKELDDFEMDAEAFLKTLDSSVDMLVICNPNNPTGKAIAKSQMDTILSHCLSLNIFVMVDETYVEFVQDVDSVSSATLAKKYGNLIVLRGISKFFAAPGLRLGYAITSNDCILNSASNDKIPWSINAYASVAGIMFEDEHYINLTKSLIHTERNLVCAALSGRKTIKVYKPDANFVLIKLLKEGQTAADVFDYCIKRGFMIRDCTDYEGLGDKYIRFCFMKPEQNDNMINTILEIV